MIAQQESTPISDPYSLFLFAMNSPVTRDRYTTRLKRFFRFIGIEGEIEEQCGVFVEGSMNDPKFHFRNIVSFLKSQKERVDRRDNRLDSKKLR